MVQLTLTGVEGVLWSRWRLEDQYLCPHPSSGLGVFVYSGLCQYRE